MAAIACVMHHQSLISSTKRSKADMINNDVAPRASHNSSEGSALLVKEDDDDVDSFAFLLVDLHCGFSEDY
jgi:hypothetical protein